MKYYTWVASGTTLTVVLENKNVMVKRDTPSGKKLEEYLKNDSSGTVPDELIPHPVERDSKGQALVFKYPVPKELEDLYAKVLEEGHLLGFKEFLVQLSENPSSRVRNTAYEFLAKHLAAILPNGEVLGYKSVRLDYLDHHSKTVDYTPGNTVEMDRALCSDDPNHTCAPGLHVGSWAYAKEFRYGNNRIILVKFSPRDIVRVPNDGEKLAVCKLTSICEISEPVSFDWTPWKKESEKGSTLDREEYDDEYDDEYDEEYDEE